MFNRANARAASTSEVSCLSTRSWVMRFQTCWLVSGSRQIRPTWVWSGVRVVLLMLPIALVSLNAAAYSGLVSAGGGPGRNWVVLSIANGVIEGKWALAAGLKSGGVGCH